jgi:hypothetical protein
VGQFYRNRSFHGEKTSIDLQPAAFSSTGGVIPTVRHLDECYQSITTNLITW